jgi:hypothetical protein
MCFLKAAFGRGCHLAAPGSREFDTQNKASERGPIDGAEGSQTVFLYSCKLIVKIWDLQLAPEGPNYHQQKKGGRLESLRDFSDHPTSEAISACRLHSKICFKNYTI